MTAKNVTNTTDSPLGLPTGQIIASKSTALIKGWEKVESNQVVKAWLDAGALTLEDAEGITDDETSDGGDPAKVANVNTENGDNSGQATTDNTGGLPPVTPAPAATPVVTFVAKTDEELEAMNNGERAAYIEKDLGGTVKSGSTKDQLIAQIKELEAPKLAANPAPATTQN